MTRRASSSSLLLLLLLLSAAAAAIVESAVLRDSDGYQQEADAFANDVYFPEHTDNRQLTNGAKRWGFFCQFECSKPTNYTQFFKCQDFNCTTPEQDNQYEACMNPSRDHGRKFGVIDHAVEISFKVLANICVKQIYSKKEPFIIRDYERSRFLEDTEDHRQLDLDVGSINVNSVLDSIREMIRKVVCAKYPEDEMCKKKGGVVRQFANEFEHARLLEDTEHRQLNKGFFWWCIINNTCSPPVDPETRRTIMCAIGVKQYCKEDTTFQEHRQFFALPLTIASVLCQLDPKCNPSYPQQSPFGLSTEHIEHIAEILRGEQNRQLANEFEAEHRQLGPDIDAATINEIIRKTVCAVFPDHEKCKPKVPFNLSPEKLKELYDKVTCIVRGNCTTTDGHRQLANEFEAVHLLEDTKHRQLDLDVGNIGPNVIFEIVRKFICATTPEAEICKKKPQGQHRQLNKIIWDDIFNHTLCALNPNCTDISQEERDKLNAAFCLIGFKSYCLEGAQPHHNFGEGALETLDFDSFDAVHLLEDTKHRQLDLDVGSIDPNVLFEIYRKVVCAATPEAEICKKKPQGQ